MVRFLWMAVALALIFGAAAVADEGEGRFEGQYCPGLAKDLRRTDWGFIELQAEAGFDDDKLEAKLRRIRFTDNELQNSIPSNVPIPRDSGMPIPQLFQYDYRTVICYYNGSPKSIHTSGCSATCVSMAVAYLMGDYRQSPEVLFRWACEQGLYSGKGLWYTQISELASQWGVTGEWIDREPERVLEALRAGYPVIAHMGAGTFTNGAHYILLRGIDEDGNILVNDPGSVDRTKVSYPLDLIVRQTKEHSFMICTPIRPIPQIVAE